MHHAPSEHVDAPDCWYRRQQQQYHMTVAAMSKVIREMGCNRSQDERVGNRGAAGGCGSGHSVNSGGRDASLSVIDRVHVYVAV